MPILPNFLYLGPDRAGSTWLFELLQWHPEVGVSPAKDVYFFDQQYHRGIEWYAHQFASIDPGVSIRAELCHDYLFSDVALDRIARDLPGVRLMVTVRDPIDRLLSAYTHMRRNGTYRGSLAQALQDHPGLVEHGLYGERAEALLSRFTPDAVHWGDFELLSKDPADFAYSVFDFLGIPPLSPPSEVLSPRLSANRARWTPLGRLARSAAGWLRKLGRPGIAGKVKSNRLIQRAVYRELTDAERPRMEDSLRRELERLFLPDVRRLEALTGEYFGFYQRWLSVGPQSTAHEDKGIPHD